MFFVHTMEVNGHQSYLVIKIPQISSFFCPFLHSFMKKESYTGLD